MTTDLIRLIEEASALAGAPHRCEILGHKWISKGGRNCGCEGIDSDGFHWTGSCSVPVHECEICGVCDYGDNIEAKEIITNCEERIEL